ncbi:MAG: hypothetical protein FWB74_05500, partial [Defluviitaleaceae bacterium]|nr:hypothetical protein [Defluviitaleaceae bacterium]
PAPTPEPTTPEPTTTPAAFDFGVVQPEHTDHWSREPAISNFQATEQIGMRLTQIFTWGATLQYLGEMGASFTDFRDPEQSYDNFLIFTPSAPIRDVQFVAVDHDWDEEDGLGRHVREILFEIDEISPDRVLVAQWINWGTIPHRAISFLDETGARRNFVFDVDNSDFGQDMYFIEF